MVNENGLANKNKELFDYLSSLLKSETSDFLNAAPEVQSIRINTLKGTIENVIQKLTARGVKLKVIDFSKAGIYIEQSPVSLSQTLDFFKGMFHFQGAASQIPPIILDPKPGEKVLDMAASPGSKTTQIAALMHNKGQLIVNDAALSRMQALNVNTQKAGMLNHCIYYLPGERIGHLFPEYFDKVLLDTPCSGLGTLSSHREIIGWWSIKKLQRLNTIQHKLFVSAIKALKVGGEMVYSTCSVAPEENELIVNTVLQKYPLEIVPIENKGMDKFDEGFTIYKDLQLHKSLKFTRRVWPHKHGLEGFFIARLRKTENYSKKYPIAVEYIFTLEYSHPDIRPVLENISENWGIDFTLWSQYRFYKTRERMWMFNQDVQKIIKEGFTNGGMLLAEKRLHLWKLSHQSIQHFENDITLRCLALNDEQIKELFAVGFCKLNNEKPGYYALELDDLPAAIVYLENGRLRIKLPHPYVLPAD